MTFEGKTFEENLIVPCYVKGYKFYKTRIRFWLGVAYCH